MDPNRYHTRPLELERCTLRAAFDKCIDLQQKRGGDEMAVALPAKASLVGALSDVLGADAVRAPDRDNTHIRKGLAMQDRRDARYR